MPSPSAFLLTWTCYGTWLPGDERGSIRLDPERGTRPEPPNRGLVHHAKANLKDHPPHLYDAMRGVIDATIRAHCDRREWRLFELAVRTNHVHVVVSGPERPEVMVSQAKAWATRRLREAGQLGVEQRVWTRHASTRYLNTEASFRAAIEYVRTQ